MTQHETFQEAAEWIGPSELTTKLADIFGHQARDAVRFKLGTRAIELDMLTDPAGGLVSVVVDGVEIGTYPSDVAEAHYRTALETARRIGMREV